MQQENASLAPHCLYYPDVSLTGMFGFTGPERSRYRSPMNLDG